MTRQLLTLCLAPAAALFAAFWLLPMAWLVALPAARGWQTYFAVLTSTRYATSLANTVALSIAVTAATLALGAAVGLYLARRRFVGRRLLLSLLSLPLSSRASTSSQDQPRRPMMRSLGALSPCCATRRSQTSRRSL